MIAIKLPVAFSSGKLMSESDPEQLVRQKIIDVLATSRRERVMNHSYGVGVYDLLYEPIDSLMMADLQHDAIQDLRRYVVGAQIIDVQLTTGGNFITANENTTMVITVKYKMPATQPTILTFNVSEFLTEESYI